MKNSAKSFSLLYSFSGGELRSDGSEHCANQQLDHGGKGIQASWDHWSGRQTPDHSSACLQSAGRASALAAHLRGENGQMPPSLSLSWWLGHHPQWQPLVNDCHCRRKTPLSCTLMTRLYSWTFIVVSYTYTWRWQTFKGRRKGGSNWEQHKDILEYIHTIMKKRLTSCRRLVACELGDDSRASD